MTSARNLCLSAVVAFIVSPNAAARGVSPYLPLNLSPDIERQIERVLVLAGKPVMRRPIAAAVVLDALPHACERDRMACDQVRQYLRRYMRGYGVTSFNVQGAAAAGDSEAVMPNRHGERVDSSWRANASGYFQWGDYVLVNAGGVAYDGEATPTGSFVSLGFDFAQLDLGFRDHWLSPLNDSSSLISTEAPTMPSITLSNYEPISSLGVTYEVFAAEMSKQDDIDFQDGTTSGRPRLAGLHGAIEPVTGYALAVNRITQYGGGARGGRSFSDFFDALIRSSNDQDVEGQPADATNRVASLTSSILFPGPTPFAVHIEYAGEDNAFEGQYRLGATNLSLGLDFPRVWRNFDFSYEVSEWQNSWYVHSVYAEGLVHRGHVIGHWFGDNRVFGDAIGGRSHMVRGGWRLSSGDYVQAAYRNLSYDSDWAGSGPRFAYHTLQTLEFDYSTQWEGRPIHAELQVGRDVFGDSYARLGASLDFVQGSSRGRGLYDEDADAGSDTDVFVDVGAHRSKVREIMLDLGPNVITGPTADAHIGVGARRRVSDRSDIGVRLEFDRIEDYGIVSVRAVDYRFRLNRKLAIGAFFGAARYDVELPAYGYYWGGGLQYIDLFPGWDVGLDFRHHEKFTRDKVLSSDPPFTVQLPRRAFDVNGVSLYLSRRW